MGSYMEILPQCAFSFVNKLFGKKVRSILPCALFELAAYGYLSTLTWMSSIDFTQGVLWPFRVRYAFDENKSPLTSEDMDEYEDNVASRMMSLEDLPECGLDLDGRLCAAVEGGGKRRIFAIGNSVNQRLLRPVHVWLMKVLKTIPIGGTFHQERPLVNLIGQNHLFSFDLKSDTIFLSFYTIYDIIVTILI